MSSYLLSGGELSELAAQVGMCDVSAIWYKTYEYRPEMGCEDRKRMFFIVLRLILEEGRARLQTAGQLLATPIPEQLDEFSRAWPPEDDWDDDMFWITKSGVGWTPSGLVWKVADGSDFWT
ncbi:DUF596 domain-containing protein [Stenotrophomonas sp. 22385]|jgi:hypothetical protein|uniref:DUF596 domain-containing protein n=1 Tax=Stenotrophomonas sp. 22385 TaxID=3453915 RepID=UPI003F831008